MNILCQRKHKIAVAVIGFLLVEYLLYQYADRPMADYVKSLDRTSQELIDSFRRITDLGKSKGYLIVCGIAALLCGFLSRGKDVEPRYRKLFAYIGARALFIFIPIALSGIMADIIKPIAGRARPALWLNNSIYGFDPFNGQGFLWNGMPSGHATTAFALACSLSLLYPRLRVLWFAYALVLAASRVMVDAHYLSDVCAGALLGWLTVRFVAKYGINPIYKIFPIDMPPSP